jgi:hypothetical protein
LVDTPNLDFKKARGLAAMNSRQLGHWLTNHTTIAKIDIIKQQ